MQCENIQISSVALLMFAIHGITPVSSLQSIIPAIAVRSPSQPAGIPSLLNFASGRHAVTLSFLTNGKHSTVIASRFHFRMVFSNSPHTFAVSVRSIFFSSEKEARKLSEALNSEK